MKKSKSTPTQQIARPRNVTTFLNKAVAYMQKGLTWQAQVECQQAIQISPENAQVRYLLGMIHLRSGKLEDAAGQMEESLRLDPANPAAYNNLGLVLKRLSRQEEAAESFRSAIRIKPDYVEAHHNLGNLLCSMRRYEDALKCLQQAITLRPNFAESHNGLGNVLIETKQYAAAIESLHMAIALRPDYSEAYSNKATVHLALDQPIEALTQADLAIKLKPSNVAAHSNRGSALAKLRRSAEALESFAAALALDSADSTALLNSGNLLLENRQYEEALKFFDRAIAGAADLTEAYEGAVEAAIGAKKYSSAIEYCKRLSDIDASYPFLKGNLVHAKMLACEWSDLETLLSSLEEDVASGKPAAEPFGYQGVAISEANLLKCAVTYATKEFPASESTPAVAVKRFNDNRITIGYLCGEFRQHATTILMCGVYETHDKNNFKLIAFDNGEADASHYRERVKAAFDEVIDISALGDADAAKLIRDRGVDILVNLNGYYGKERTGIFAHRPSSLQVNYLGFPGTLGAPYMDYLIADEVVIPKSSREFYSEKIVYLPYCYQANDSQRTVSDRIISREEFGIPSDAFVYCCFNNNYKITPQTLDVWIRILLRARGSYLWLLEDNPTAMESLRREAQVRGLQGHRLIFAKRLPLDEHLARHKLADIFLDTLPYNAHTTASDSLWAGLPVLTMTGTTFPGRVTTSLLNAIQLPELITSNVIDYENLAVRMYEHPEELAQTKAKLHLYRDKAPLFDTGLFTKHLEKAYRMMLQRRDGSIAPEHFGVEP